MVNCFLNLSVLPSYPVGLSPAKPRESLSWTVLPSPPGTDCVSGERSPLDSAVVKNIDEPTRGFLSDVVITF